jgi:elongation factor 1-beta
MADAIVTLTIMPESPEIDLTKMEEVISKTVAEFHGEVGKTEVEPIAFGLNALKVIFVIDEAHGATDPIEDAVEKLEGIQSVEVTDVRRALG